MAEDDDQQTEEYDFSSYEVMLQADLPVWGFRIVQYMNEEGSLRLAWKIDGDVESSALIGALEMAKMRIMIEDSGEFDHFVQDEEDEE